MPARKVIQQGAWVGLSALLALGFGWLIAREVLLGFGFIGGAVALLLVVFCFTHVEWSLYILTAYAFFNSGLAVLLVGSHFQAGIPFDVLLLFTLAGLSVQRTRVRLAGQEFFRSPVVLWWMVLFVYIVLCGANPLVHSQEAWLMQIRKSAEELLLLFISYCVFDTPQRIKNFLKALFVMSVLVGVYGCIQQWHGLFGFEESWVMADPTRYGLFFVMGDYRKMSVFSDPTTFGIVMAAITAFYIISAIFQRTKWKRYLLLGGCMFMALGMFYSGTRTANVVLLAGLAMYILLNANKASTWVFAISIVAALLLALNLPIYSSSTLNRFRTTFQGAKDASYNVREMSRAFIQPYIYDHPFGGGLGTTNNYGQLNNPGHYLAGFQTDDGYLKFALEIGWVGLLLICAWNFLVLRTGIRGYFRARNAEARYLYIAGLACLVPFMVALLAQDVIGQLTNDAVIFPMIALLMRLNVFEEKQDLDEKQVL